MLHHQVLKDDMEFLELQHSKGHRSLAKYVQEFIVKLTFVPIKEELSKKLNFLQGLEPWAQTLVFQCWDTLETCQNNKVGGMHKG
jgi:hypothetical protein